MIFLSDKSEKINVERYILFKNNVFGNKGIGIVIEHKQNGERAFIVTSMIAKYSYLERKYKKLR